jgi:hypothetical protein
VGTVEVTHKGKRRGRKKMLTPEQFKAKSEEYFDICIEREEAPTIAGLAFHLGFSSRQSLHDYAKDPEYKNELERARLFIEAWVSKRVLDRDTFTAGQIFYLKSVFGYEDKQSVDHTSSDGSLRPTTIRLTGPDDDN